MPQEESEGDLHTLNDHTWSSSCF